MPSNHLGLCHPLLLLLSIFPSVRVFSNESVLHIRWPKYWSFSFSISFSNENSGFISFRFVWFDLLAVQGTLKSLLQHSPSRKQTEEKYPNFSLRVPSLSPIGLTQQEVKKQGCVGDAIIGVSFPGTGRCRKWIGGRVDREFSAFIFISYFF